MTDTYLSLFRGAIEKPARPPLPGEIIAEVAARYGLTRADLEGPRRFRRLTGPRQEAMYELRKRTKLSLPHIGMFLGDRDHTTVLHGIRAHQARLEAAE